MRIAVLCGSIRQGNTSLSVARAHSIAAERRGWQADILELTAFDRLFNGDYITFETATAAQRTVLETMAAADALLIVTPTYYKGIPGVLKNFFDSVKWPEIYNKKIIGVVQCNHKGQDYAGVQVKRILDGLLTFFDLTAVVVHDIVIIEPLNINYAAVEHSLDLIERYFQIIRTDS